MQSIYTRYIYILYDTYLYSEHIEYEYAVSTMIYIYM